MRRDGSFESGDMVVAIVGKVPCSGFVHSDKREGNRVVAYMVELSVDHGGPAVEVPIENVRNYWEGF